MIFHHSFCRVVVKNLQFKRQTPVFIFSPLGTQNNAFRIGKEGNHKGEKTTTRELAIHPSLWRATTTCSPRQLSVAGLHALTEHFELPFTVRPSGLVKNAPPFPPFSACCAGISPQYLFEYLVCFYAKNADKWTIVS